MGYYVGYRETRMIDPSTPDEGANMSGKSAAHFFRAGMSEEQIIAQMRDKERLARRVVYVVVPLVSMLAFATAFIGGRGTMNNAFWWAVGIGSALIFCALAWLTWSRPPAAVLTASIVAKRTDEFQRGYLRQLWVFPIEVLCLAPLVVAATRHLLDPRGPKLIGLPAGIATTSYLLVLGAGLLTLVVVTLLLLLGVGFPKAIRPALDDELNRAQRATAVVSGFVASLVGGLGAFVAGLIEPRWAVLGLPFVIMGAIAVSAVHLVVLDRRADAGG